MLPILYASALLLSTLPAELPKSVVDAWQKAGAQTVVWMLPDEIVDLKYTAKSRPGAIPVFRFENLNDVEFARLPNLGIPFGLWANVWTPQRVTLENTRGLGEMPLKLLIAEGRYTNDDELTKFLHIRTLTHLHFPIVELRDASMLRLSRLVDLEYLNLSSIRLTEFHVSTLTHWPKLRILQLHVLSGEGLKTVAKLKNLEQLRINNCDNLKDDDFKALAELKDFKTLHLGGNNHALKLLDGLAGCTGLRHLKIDTFIDNASLTSFLLNQQLDSLCLNSGTSKELLAALASSKTLRELKWNTGPLQPKEFALLCDIISLETLQLHILDHERRHVTDEEFKAVSKLVNLRNLTMYSSKLTSRSISVLADLKKMESLCLNGEMIGDDAASEFAKLTNLRELDLHSTKLTEAGLASLAKLEKLEKLKLGQLKLTARGFETLKSFNGLRELSIDESVASKSDLADFRKARPNVKIGR